jgi:hypothetical protein
LVEINTKNNYLKDCVKDVILHEHYALLYSEVEVTDAELGLMKQAVTTGKTNDVLEGVKSKLVSGINSNKSVTLSLR